MGLEERQSNLENEMHTAKDTIWRLTNRVVHLEKQVTTLKALFQTSSGGFSRTKSKTNILKSAKLAEIARRKQKIRDLRESIASTSASLQSKTEQQIVVKEEALSDCSDATLRSDDENCDPHFESRNDCGPAAADESLVGKWEVRKVESSDSSSSDSDDDCAEDSRRHSGRNKSKIWKHFHTKTVKADDGKGRILAVCKHCNKQVSPKSDRLRNHVKKCLASSKPPSRDVSWGSLGLDASMEELEASYLMDMDSDSNHALDKETIATALAQSTAVHENTVGRKKGPVWKHFATATTTKSNGQLRIHAICKRCKKEVSPKSDRLRNHVIKCNILSTHLGTPPRKGEEEEGEGEEEGGGGERIQEEETARRRRSESGKEEKGCEVVGGVAKVSGVKKGAVWQHFSTSTTQTTDNNTRITVTCNYCNKEVSPKSDRLKKHIDKCQRLSTATPTNNAT